jgi:hypothetical protein
MREVAKMANFWYNYTSSNRINSRSDIAKCPAARHQKGKFLMQPHSTLTPSFPENLTDYAPWVAKYGLTAPYGECQCGCGKSVSLAKKTESRIGYQKGKFRRYLSGHRIVNCRTIVSQDETDSGTRKIGLTKGKFAVVDANDYEMLLQWKWYAEVNGHVWYAFRCEKSEGEKRNHKVFMHRVILNAFPQIEVDHIDGDGLNNSRSNLRACTHQQNSMNRRVGKGNSSGYKGVSWHKSTRKWVATIRFRGKHMHLGLFDSIESAAMAYNVAANELFGDFARLNQMRVEAKVMP